MTAPDLFAKSSDGYSAFRIPAIVKSTRGTLLAFCEGRVNSASDTGDINLVLRRSVDGGTTWSPLITVWDDGTNTCGNPAPVVDPVSGRIHLLMTWNLGSDSESTIKAGTSSDTRRPYYTYSDDDGQTWSTPVDITSQVKPSDATWYATGPCHAIVMSTGRIVVPCDYITSGTNTLYSTVIYSDDSGTTWQAGGAVSGGNECSVAELSDGSLMLSARQGSGYRMHSTSEDGDLTWSSLVTDESLPDPRCQASLLGTSLGSTPVLFFSNPADSESRINGTVRISLDDGQNWSSGYLAFSEYAGYSDLVKLDETHVGLLAENGSSSSYDKISFLSVDISDIPFAVSLGATGTSTYVGRNLSFSLDGVGDQASCQWTFEGGSPSSSSEQSPEIAYSTVGRYDVSLTVTAGSVSQTFSKSDLISVYPGDPLLFLPFDGDYADHSDNGIQIDRIDGSDAVELLNYQAGRKGFAADSSAYFPGFNNSKYSVLSITDETFASKFNSTGNFVISFWLKPRYGKSGTSYFFSQGTGAVTTGWHYMRIDNQVSGSGNKYRLFYQMKYTNSVDDDKMISYKYNYDGVNTPSTYNIDLRDQSWHHIVVRCLVEGTETKTMSWKMYIDGQGPLNNNAQTVKTLDSYIPFVIGAKYVTSSGAYSDTMQGNIDDFIVWNKSISNAQMEALCSY